MKTFAKESILWQLMLSSSELQRTVCRRIIPRSNVYSVQHSRRSFCAGPHRVVVARNIKFLSGFLFLIINVCWKFFILLRTFSQSRRRHNQSWLLEGRHGWFLRLQKESCLITLILPVLFFKFDEIDSQQSPRCLVPRQLRQSARMIMLFRKGISFLLNILLIWSHQY